MAHVDDQRVARVLDALEAQHPGAQLLVNDPWSIYYLTGFYADMLERFCGVLLARGSEPVILVNALHQLPEYDNARVAYHTDTDVVADAIASEIDPAKPLGIDTVMRSGFLMPLMERHAASEFFLGDFAVTAARTHKDAAEQELMRASSAANDAVMADAIKLVHEGVTEREIADQMLGLYRKHGCEGFSFPPIVSFGANAGDPHHEPDDTVLKRGARGAVRHWRASSQLLLGHDAHVLLGRAGRGDRRHLRHRAPRQRGRRGAHRTGRAHVRPGPRRARRN